jgi:hypothetical protein
MLFIYLFNNTKSSKNGNLLCKINKKAKQSHNTPMNVQGERSYSSY